MLPKLVLTDVDGVLTDGGMYYDENGNEWKKFNTSDSLGVLLCKALGIKVAFITGENTNIVKRRAEKLKVDIIIQGSNDKQSEVKKLCNTLSIKLSDVAFIGDDLIDLPLLKKVKFSGAPPNASEYIRAHVNYVTLRAGGNGAFRDFVEEFLRRENLLEMALEMVLKNNYTSNFSTTEG